MLLTESSTRRIARNTLMLYLRTLLSVVVGLYTSRIVLHALGVEDYGIYGLVGGIVSVFGFLNTSMVGATSRFITYDIGKGDIIALQQTFNTAFQSHLFIAFVVVFFSETIGLWFINYQLDIPQERYFAANCIYQLSILSAIVGITQAPYSAVILAHEQMDVYAWLEILNVILKLIIVWLIQLATNDRLIFYGLLVFAVTVLIRSIYRIYCHRHYPESHLCFVWNPTILRKMLSFTGWSLYYDAGEAIRLQGVNILINRFFGVILNASCSLASMIQGTCWLFGHNVVVAFRPQIIKQYAACNYSRMQQLIRQALKFTLLISGFIFIPIIVDMPFLIHLWLGFLPPFLVVFCRIYLLDTIIGLINYILGIGISAQGNIKMISFISGTLKFLCLPVIGILFYFSYSPVWAYWCNLFCLLVIVAVDFYVLKKNIPQLNIYAILSTCFVALFTLFICSLVYLSLRNYLPCEIPYKLLAASLFITICSIFSYYCLLDNFERKGLCLLLHRKIKL